MRGAGGRLASTVPAVTPPAWTSLVTGVDPGRHGIYSFTVPGAQDYTERFVTSAERRVPSLWHYLTAAGRSVGVFNVSLSYPPEPVSGFLFAGFDCPVLGPHMAYPEQAFHVAMQGVSGYVHEGLHEVRGAPAAREIQRQLRQQRDMLCNLLREFPVEILAVNFNGPDHVHHHAWPLGQTTEQLAASTGSPVEDVYREVDGILGDLLERYTDENTHLVLVSDHGGGMMRGQVSLARALEAGGFLARRAGARPHRESLSWPRRWAHRLLPRRLRASIWRLGGMQFRQDMAQQLRAAEVAQIDWSRSAAFPWGSSGFVQVNVKGRQPEGCVDPGDRDRILEEVEACLRELRDPLTGAAPLDHILRGEALYREPRAGYVPDLVVEDTEYAVLPHWKDELAVSNLSEMGESYRGITANHRPYGILATWGPAVRPGSSVPALGMADIAPAVLYLAGVPLPEGLEGRLADGLWDTGVKPQTGGTGDAGPVPTASASPYSEQEQAAVEQRLRDLGYM
jgi:predicted AlkP superfamily phosphohydrolase/phosphomutase